jgi:hypothetical protein
MSTAEAAVLPGTGRKQAARQRLESVVKNLRLAGPELELLGRGIGILPMPHFPSGAV